MNINLMTWFAERQLDHCPVHFKKASTPIDDKKIYWILENLSGRFYIEVDRDLFNIDDSVYFEDPKELVLYELTWS